MQRRNLPEVFKREAVERVGSSGLTVGKVASELGIAIHSLGGDSAPVGTAGVIGRYGTHDLTPASSREYAR